MMKELNRLASFSTWTTPARVIPMRMARYGFYHSDDANETVCFSCGVHIRDWKDHDDPLEKHRQVSPLCDFLTGNDNSNVPMDPSFSINDRKTGNQHGSPLNNALESARDRATARGVFTGKVEYRIDRNNPDYDLLRMEKVRLGTFEDWPPTAYAIPEALAQVGFYYTGKEDRVQCAFCRGFLKQWQPTDTPMGEHLKHYPDCPFVTWPLEVGNVPIGRDPVGRDPGGTNPVGRDPGGRETIPPPRIITSPTNTEEVTPSPLFTREPVQNSADVKMNTPAVRAILNLGYYSYDVIKRLIEEKMTRTGTDFPNAESLMEALFHVKDETINTSFTASASVFPSPASSTNESLSSSEVPSSSSSSSVNSSEEHPLINIGGLRLTSEPGTLPSGDSGVCLSNSSSQTITTASLPVIPELNFPSTTTSLPSIFGASALAQSMVPSGTTEVLVGPSTIAMTTVPEVDRSAKDRVKGTAKRRRIRRKQQQMTVVSNASRKEEETRRNERMTELETVPSDAETYEEENRRLHEARTCKVCMDAEVNTVFLPCGHLVCCYSCSSKVRDCPVCRTYIRGTVKTFLS